MNVINTGIHTLELQQQVDPEKLKSLENIAAELGGCRGGHGGAAAVE